MRIIHLYNQQRSMVGGEESAIYHMASLFRQNGHDVHVKYRSSREYSHDVSGRLRAFSNGINNPAAYAWLAAELTSIQPDLVHLHSVYPVLSPSVLRACEDSNVPVVMSVHSQWLTCPAWYHMRDGRQCEKCLDGSEAWCVIHNCLGSLPKSVAYAARSAAARIRRDFRRRVTAFITMNSHHRDRLIRAGYSAERIFVIRHSVECGHPPERGSGEYVGFVGRMSREKGVWLLIEAARRLESIPFRLAGVGPEFDRLRAAASPNVTFVGALDRKALRKFYEGCRALAIPSICSETGPLVALEAFERGCPVVGSGTPGGLSELVIEGTTGWVIEPNSIEELSTTIERLWRDPMRSYRLGQEARRYFLRELSPTQQYDRMLAVYTKVLSGSLAHPG